MHDTMNRRVKPVAAALALVLSVAVVAPPPLAAEPARAQQPATLQATATAKVAALSGAELAAAQDAAAPAATESQSVFKSRKAVIAMVLFAAGTTFTFVSKHKDRVKSQVRN